LNPTTSSWAGRKRPCPICRSVESRRLFHQTFEQLSGIEFIDGYDVVVCAECGLAFADGIPDQTILDAYYRDLSKYEYEHQGGKESPLDERRFREIAATIEQFVPARDSRVLEIGCATGRLLSLLEQRGFAGVQGLDPSPGCARAAWELYRVPVAVGSLFGISAFRHSFDFVILIGVLEHVEDLDGALRHIRSMLGPSGRVYAEVPDAANLTSRPDSPYQEFSTEHINFFSTTSLTNLFRVHGFDVLATGESVRQAHENTTYPAAFGVYGKNELASQMTRDEVTERGLRQYIEESSGVESRIRQRIRNVAGGRRVLVWGTGTHTQRLLAIRAFEDVDIVAFVDSNPKYHGRELHAVPVLSPSALAGRQEAILISTRGFQSEIQEQIRRQLNLDNEVILLYDDE
jgi:SAM-dependent methyltransferase